MEIDFTQDYKAFYYELKNKKKILNYFINYNNNKNDFIQRILYKFGIKFAYKDINNIIWSYFNIITFYAYNISLNKHSECEIKYWNNSLYTVSIDKQFNVWHQKSYVFDLKNDIFYYFDCHYYFWVVNFEDFIGFHQYYHKNFFYKLYKTYKHKLMLNNKKKNIV